MKFIKNNSKKIITAIMITFLIIYLILDIAPQYIASVFIIKHLSSFIFFGLSVLIVINFLKKWIIESMVDSTKKKILMMNILAIITTVFAFYAITTNIIEIAEDEQLIERNCTLYDINRNKIYEQNIYYTCPEVEVEINTSNHLKLSGNNKVEGIASTSSFFPAGTVGLNGETIIVNEKFDIDVTYFENGMIDFYQAWQTITVEINDNDESHLRYFSTYLWVKNDLNTTTTIYTNLTETQPSGFDTKRDIEYYYEEETSSSTTNFNQHYPFGDPDFDNPSIKITSALTADSSQYFLDIKVYEKTDLSNYELTKEIKGTEISKFNMVFELNDDIHGKIYSNYKGFYPISGYEEPIIYKYEIFSFTPYSYINDTLIYDSNITEDSAFITSDYSTASWDTDYDYNWRNYNDMYISERNKILLTDYGYLSSEIRVGNLNESAAFYLSRAIEPDFEPTNLETILIYESFSDDVIKNDNIIRDYNPFYEYYVNLEKTLD